MPGVHFSAKTTCDMGGGVGRDEDFGETNRWWKNDVKNQLFSLDFVPNLFPDDFHFRLMHLIHP